MNLRMLTFIGIMGLIISHSLGSAEAQTGALCQPFSENQTDFQPCPTHPNVGFSIQTDTANTSIGDYLRLVDGSGASGVCSGALGSGTQTAYTGNWYEKTVNGCQSLCYDTRLFSTAHVGTATVDILGISISSNSGITDQGAYFRPNSQYSADIGSDAGWKQICVPIELIDAGDPLPSNSHGQWEIAGTNAYSSDWNNIIQDVEQLFLRTDVNDANGNSAPGEVIGYDNFCLGDCDGVDEVEPTCPDCELCCPPWTQSQFENIFNWSQDSATTYNVNYESTAILDAQMNAWLAYVQTLRPDVQAVNIWFYPLECPQDVPVGTPCLTSFQPFDVTGPNPPLDFNLLQWTGTGVGVHKNVETPYSSGTSWSNSGTSLTKPFNINQLYRVYAMPILLLNDGSFEFVGEGWFGDCPIGEMETNFQIQFRSANQKGAPATRTKIVSSKVIQSSRETREMVEKIKQTLEESKKTASKPVKTEWTNWINSDRPGGNGDYQMTKSFKEKGQICSDPVAIECRTVKGQKDWRSTGEKMTCNVETGGYCVNKEQSDRRCEDYEVRYSCPVK